MSAEADGPALRSAATGGRVVSTAFLGPVEADRLLGEVRAPGVAATAWGGYAGARRRVVTVRPEHVPEAGPKLVALYFAGVVDADALLVGLRAAGVSASALGDTVVHQGGVSVMAIDPPPDAAMLPIVVAGVRSHAERVPCERVTAGRERTLDAVVPALRVDVLGARAFGVSRSYFAKGVAAGRVSVNGRAVGKGGEAAAGDEVWAEGLGRFRVREVHGETRRGNLKVTLEVERA